MANPRKFAALCSVLCVGGLLAGGVEAGQCSKGAKTSQESQVVTATYEVADLVIPVETPASGGKTIEDKLMVLIRHMVDPGSWEENGGSASLQYYPLGLTLAVRQTQANQEKVQELLNLLRRAQDVEVAVEIWIVSLASIGEHFVKLAGFREIKADDQRQSCNVAFLSEAQAKSWVKLLQCDPNTLVWQAPKVTVFNGQPAKIFVGDELSVVDSYKVVEINGKKVVEAQQKAYEYGLRSQVLPVVSADRRFVRLHIDFTSASIDNDVPLIPVTMAEAPNRALFVQKPTCHTLKLDKVVVIPDSGTAVFQLGKDMVEACHESGAPTLSKIPDLARLFTNTSYCRETRDEFLLVTTRVIPNEETNAVPPVAVPPIPR